MSAGSMLWETPFLEETLRGQKGLFGDCQSMMNDHSLLPLARDDARSSTRARERACKKYFYASSSPSSSISRRASTRATANRTSHHPMIDRDRRESWKSRAAIAHLGR
jgi:hypothetical protein|tara:strand:+ start:9744 stop:10067 length:324 start_codon:yes stop_codon:yes gene_type:complete